MKIAIGADHGGFSLKEIIKEDLVKKGYEVKDFGTYSKDSVDYPDIAKEVTSSLNSNESEFGILVCGTGIGMSMAANKVSGIRAAVVSDVFSARATKEHNNANIICLGERVVGPGLALLIVEEYMKSEYQGGRHQTRIDKIMRLESK